MRGLAWSDRRSGFPRKYVSYFRLWHKRTNSITALMSAGASLIISDVGLSHETGRGTDFIVLTR